ncbi:hypothetical protein [Streptomyces sp. PTD5-9]|uniref:hypothetical protein n=1 Tax=Streptomyces sp. PTD5-9 TaxID=3120150 RepID=UPI00300A41CF
MDGEGQGRPQRERVPLPPEDLRAVLAPVDLAWARLEQSGARQLVASSTRTEPKTVEGYAGRADAPQVLADRLARRLAEQLRAGGQITEPVGWLLARGLPQRRECGDARCDDRAPLDSGRDCPRCAERQEDRRDQRRAVAAAVGAAMPRASEAERRAATVTQLHQDVTARTWAKAYEWEKVRARQAAAALARAEAAAAHAEDQVPVAPAAPAVLPAPLSGRRRPSPGVANVDDDQELVLEDLTCEQVLDRRNRAAADR